MRKIIIAILLINLSVISQNIMSKKFIGLATDAKYVRNVRPYTFGESSLNLWIKTDSTEVTIQCPNDKQITIYRGDSIFIYITEFERLIGIESSNTLYKKAR